MGSELRLVETDSSKILRERLIWGGDLNVIWQSLAEQPDVFSSKNIKPGKILRYLTGFPFPLRKRPVYGPLLEHLVNHYHFQEGDNLLEFGYDWRACNVKSSKVLAQFLEKRTDEVDRVTLIAHSMGALICRAFLAEPTFAHLHSRIHKVIQLGAPVLGSPKAFFTLKNSPRINALFDVALRKRQKKNPELYHFLHTSLESFQSLFQLLPPTTEQIVFDVAGTQYSALNPALWGSEVGPLLKGAETLHDLLTGLSSDKLFALYSTTIPTERAYLIDARKMVKEISKPLISGDGTVTIASASAATMERNRISFGGINHDTLPTSPEVWRSLEGLL
jgi:pimeloyl-ACP methyl ester carboxylesterase